MKRVILSLTIIAFSFGLNAQSGNQEMPKEEIPGKAPMLKFNKNEKLNISNDWYNYYQEMSQLSSGWVSFLDYLFPDSTVQWVNNTGDGVYAWKLAQGQVLDPTSQYFIFDSKPISKAANYTLDSVAIQYAYRRTQTANPDTLLIQVFKSDSMGYVPSPNWTDPRSYCRPLYDDVANKGVGAFKEFKILLREADTAVTFARTLTQAIDIDVAPDEEIAVSVHYIPGNPYQIDDTLSRTLDGPGIINSFAMYNGRDEAKTDEPDHYNHALMITNSIRYGVNPNNWNGRYFPGVAFGSGIYHSNIYFNITYDDYTGIKESKVLNHLDLYPNPSSSFVNVEYDIKQGQQVKLEFTNLLGHTVYEDVLPINGSKTRVDVSTWSKGLYFYSLLVDGQVVGTERLVVSD